MKLQYFFKKSDPLATSMAALACYLKLLLSPVLLEIPWGELAMFLCTGLLTYLGTILGKWLTWYVAIRFDIGLLKRLLKIDQA